MVLSKVIKECITKNGENKIYTVSDFADLNNDMLVTRVLSRLKEEEFLVRLSQGIYLYPSRNRFGICKPSIDEIANAIAEKDHARIIPSGLTALNKLGLSTQVPMNAVYITNGTPRTIKLGNRSITFKKGTPRYFAYQSRIFTMVVIALKEIGEEKTSDEIILKIKLILDTEEKEKVNHDYKIAPQWIRRKLKPILYGNN